ncbi:MAG: hypothetical protein Q4D27_08195 [Coriobacteriia bacterium]|nr:hypothetical protein [Coriobacteriia bacterium]
MEFKFKKTAKNPEFEGVEPTRERGAEIGWAPWSVRFWRCMAIGFCVFSIMGHWMEIPYCLFMDWAFGIVSDDSLVFSDPMYPFLVYGFAAVGCSLALVPQRDWLRATYKNQLVAAFVFFLLAAFTAMMGEIILGSICNQPDPVTGVYPLWDNSVLPFNVLGQAWLVNDVLLGLIITLYVWVLYPLLVKLVGLVPERWGWPVTIVIVVAFVILCIVKFS